MSAITQKAFNDAARAFAKNPSALNFNVLESAALSHQKAVKTPNEFRREVRGHLFDTRELRTTESL